VRSVRPRRWPISAGVASPQRQLEDRPIALVQGIQKVTDQVGQRNLFVRRGPGGDEVPAGFGYRARGVRLAVDVPFRRQEMPHLEPALPQREGDQHRPEVIPALCLKRLGGPCPEERSEGRLDDVFRVHLLPQRARQPWGDRADELLAVAPEDLLAGGRVAAVEPGLEVREGVLVLPGLVPRLQEKLSARSSVSPSRAGEQGQSVPRKSRPGPGVAGAREVLTCVRG
jgi:hypothetical protein